MKIITVALLSILALSACDKLPGGNSSRSTFVKMCKEDPNAKAQEFDCGCQADILTAVLKEDEMTKLIDFIGIEKQDKNKAMEMGKDPVYAPIFQKIAGVGYAIHDKCGKPGTPSAPQAAAPQQATPPQQSQPVMKPSNFQPATVVGRPTKK